MLPSLHKLFLTEGEFTSDHLPLHLTNLTLQECELHTTQACACLTLLVKLRVISSVLTLVGPGDLSACEELQLLDVNRGQIRMDSADDWLNCSAESLNQFPTNWSALTSLSVLYIVIAGITLDPELDLRCFYCLTSLQRLRLYSDTTCLYVSSGLTDLQRLTSLTLSAKAYMDEDSEVYVRLDVEWQRMQRLQNLNIYRHDIFCNDSILGLTQLQQLQHVHFKKCKPYADDFSFRCLSILMYRLARYCSHVTVIIDEESAKVEDETNGVA